MTIKLQGTNSAAAPGLTNDGADGIVVGTDSVDISIAGTSKVKVNSSGNVGIGTTSPNNKLDVNGGIVCSPNTDGKDTFELSTHAANEGRLNIKNIDTTTVSIRAGGDSYLNGGDLSLGDGDLVIGTAGHGIDFSAQTASSATGATTTAELLDHYEEGTFTPAWKGVSNHGTTSYGDTNTACYTKIGNIVHVQGYSKISGNSGGSGGWIMDNLPFPAWNNDAQSTGSLMMYSGDLPAGSGWANVYANKNTSNMYVYNSEDNGIWQQFTIANDSAVFFIFQITYTTSA